MAAGMGASRSEFLRVRGLRYHVRRWGDVARPPIVLLHGWLDVSETFHHLVQDLLDRWQVLAPDWRGFGYTEWNPGGYWFPDYLGDLDALLDHYVPDAPVLLVGHSMGAQVSGLYAGVRPERISRLVCLDGPFLPDMQAQESRARMQHWLNQLRAAPRDKFYASFEELAERVRAQHPRLDAGRALFIARCWGHQDGHGRIRLCADPQHRHNMPTLYRFADTEPMWSAIRAPTLFVDAADSNVRYLDAAEIARRRACIGDHRVVQIADCGHMLHFDRPRETAAEIGRFFDVPPDSA